MIQSARERLAGVLSRRVQSQVIRAERIRARTASTVYAGQNRVQPLGAETSVRPRGLQTNSGLPIGAPVQFNQGLAAATPKLSSATVELENALIATSSRNDGFQAGTNDPNTATVKARYPYDGYVQLDGSGNIASIWVWNDTAQTWKEFSGGGLTLLTGDGPPSSAIGSVGDLYLDIGYPDGGGNTGTDAMRLYVKLASYPSSTEAFWYEVGRRATLGAPTTNGTYNGQMHTTRGGMNYAWWNGFWRRPCRHTHGPNPPDLKQVGDTHTVPTPVGDPVTRIAMCVYEYDGSAWVEQGCECADCGPAPPEEPYPDDYPADCTGTGGEDALPNRPYPDPNNPGEIICTFKVPDPGT